MRNSLIDLSPDALQKRREIAEKATPGPWIDKSGKHGTSFWVGRAEDVIDVALTFTVENFAHIAANSPDAVIAMIDEIERLRREMGLLRLKYIEKIKNHEQDFITLNQEIDRLRNEADWLAGALSGLGNPESDFFDRVIQDCPNPRIHNECFGDCKSCWRKAARKAVETAREK